MQVYYSKLKTILKPTWRKIILSIILAFVFGIMLGLFLYIDGTCWFSEGNTCAAYSPLQIFFAYLFSWPILLMQKLMVGNYNNFDSVIEYKFGWLAILLYYYLLVGFIGLLINKNIQRE